MNLENIMVCEIKSERQILYKTTYMWKTDTYKENRNRLTDIEDKLVVTKLV